ncbi:hypothetical protein TNCV_4344761 [Trichonephila clavipes]|nr:hypothetical protein TNCV_4344761 [Trichonephila clavipes]
MFDLDIDKKITPSLKSNDYQRNMVKKIIVELEDGSVISLPQRCVNRASDYLKLNVIISLHFVCLGSKDTEFVTWKEEENKTMSKYVRQRGSKTLLNGEIVMNYHCCVEVGHTNQKGKASRIKRKMLI